MGAKIGLMKIVLFLKPDFISENDREVQWLEKFSEALSLLGVEVGRFVSHEHRLKDYDLVHVFSGVEPEIWFGLKSIVGRVVVTPSLNQSLPQVQSPMVRSIGRFMNFMRNRFANPEPGAGRFHDFQTADHYLVVGTSWKSFLSSNWGVGENQISLLSADPESAARAAFEVYKRQLNHN
jgi:hypothetical protein